MYFLVLIIWKKCATGEALIGFYGTITRHYIKLTFQFRAQMTRVLFNTLSNDWSQCMEKCRKYNRAQAPSFTDQTELEELITWAHDAVMDPVSEQQYPDVFSGYFWMSFR